MKDVIHEYFQSEQATSFFKKSFKSINTNLLRINDTRCHEYHPLVNQRAHLMKSANSNILNQDFRRVYEQFLRYLIEVPRPGPTEWIVLAYYLLLQDRIDESIVIFKRIDAKAVIPGMFRLQYDYCAAYLDFYEGYPNFKVARAICQQYLNYPVISWRKPFIDIANQLAEYDGEEMIDDEDINDDRQKKLDKLADLEETLDITLDGTSIIATCENVEGSLNVKYYDIDLEVLFSRNPFLSKVHSLHSSPYLLIESLSF